MTIIKKAIHIIDYENSRVLSRDTPTAFEAYVTDLINHIGSNNSVREYKTRSNTTEVIGSILTICSELDNAEIIISKMENIAQRLLLKETEAQEKIARTSTNVQKGSLIQALLSNDSGNGYIYLLAKVEHSAWVDDTDFSFKTGFSKDKKTIWKSCLIDLVDLDAKEFQAKVYSNTIAKYWSDGFLEFDEMNSDEANTKRAFTAIDITLNQFFKGYHNSRDQMLIRNDFIGYLRHNEHIDYPTMVNSILENYQPIDQEYMTKEKVKSICDRLLEQPQKRKFDNQFSSISKVINARIKKVFPITDGIELKINSDINNLPGTIQSIEENGVKYIRIRTNNEDTFKIFQTSQITKQ